MNELERMKMEDIYLETATIYTQNTNPSRQSKGIDFLTAFDNCWWNWEHRYNE